MLDGYRPALTVLPFSVKGVVSAQAGLAPAKDDTRASRIALARLLLRTRLRAVIARRFGRRHAHQVQLASPG